MARPPRGNAQDPARKRLLDEFDRRLTAMEGQVRTHEDRMENLEYRFELETSYRYIRIENSPGLDQMFKDLAAKTMENSEIRERSVNARWTRDNYKLPAKQTMPGVNGTPQQSGKQLWTQLTWPLWWIYALGLGITDTTCVLTRRTLTRGFHSNQECT